MRNDLEAIQPYIIDSDGDLPLYSFGAIGAATNFFCTTNYQVGWTLETYNTDNPDERIVVIAYTTLRKNPKIFAFRARFNH